MNDARTAAAILILAALLAVVLERCDHRSEADPDQPVALKWPPPEKCR